MDTQMAVQQSIHVVARTSGICAWLLLSGWVVTTLTAEELESKKTPPAQGETVKVRVEKARAAPKLEDQLNNLSQLGETLSREEVPEALELADGLKRLRERGVLREATLKRWAKLAPTEAFEAIAKLPECRDKAEILRYAAIKFAEADPQQAASAVMKLPAGRSRHDAIEGIASAWAQTDPTQAMQWASQLPFGAAKQSAMYAIRFVWVHVDPVTAARHVAATVPRDDIKNALLSNIATEWAILDTPRAIKWARGLSHEPEKELALATVAESWANRDPESAMEFASKLAPSNLRDQAMVMVLGRWATEDPRKAADWLRKREDESLQKRGLEAVLSLWGELAPVEAGKWIEELKPGPFKTAAIESYVKAVTPWAPDMGLRLVLRMAPHTAAQPQVEACARHWLQLDPLPAGEWIDASAFPEDVKAKWCSPIKE